MSRKLGIAASIAAAAAIAVAVAVLYTYDPSTAGIYPLCPSKLLTGYDCPGCGSLRCMHALFHGRLAAAWAFNPAVFFAVPLALFFVLVRYLPPRSRVYRLAHHPAVPWAVLVAIVAWTVLRNV